MLVAGFGERREAPFDPLNISLSRFDTCDPDGTEACAEPLFASPPMVWILLMIVSLLGLKFSVPRRLTGCDYWIFARSFAAVSVILASCASLSAICFLRSCYFCFSSRRRFFLLWERLLRSLLLLLEPLGPSGLRFFSLSSCMLAFRPFMVCTEEGILTLPILPSDRALSSRRVGVAMSFAFEVDFLRPTVATDPRLLLNVTLPKLWLPVRLP